MHFTFDTLLLTVEDESPIVCRLATVLPFFSTWSYWSLRPMCPRAVEVLTVFHAQPSLKRILLKLFTCNHDYRLCRLFVSASTRRFQKIMQRPDADDFILTSMCMLHVISGWYTSDFNVVAINF